MARPGTLGMLLGSRFLGRPVSGDAEEAFDAKTNCQLYPRVASLLKFEDTQHSSTCSTSTASKLLARGVRIFD